MSDTMIAVQRAHLQEAQQLLTDAQEAFDAFFNLLLSAKDTRSSVDASGLVHLLTTPSDNLRQGVRELMNATNLPGPGQMAEMRSGKLRIVSR